MADDVLRLRTTVVSGEALADMRSLAREIGLLPRQAQRGVQGVNTELRGLGATIKQVGNDLRRAMPSLARWVLSCGVFATRQIAGAFADVSKSIVQLGHTSRELGLTTQQVKGFLTVAEKAGIAPQAMMAGMAGFKRVVEDLHLRLPGLREEMGDAGFGRVAERIAAAANEMDAYKEAWGWLSRSAGPAYHGVYLNVEDRPEKPVFASGI
jgi:hypothetical protein